jgi:L-lactate dehydrogenase
MKLEDFCRAQGVELTAPDRQNIYEQTRDAAYQIIKRKGATYYAVAAGLIAITAALLRDQNTVFSVSTLIEDYYGIQDVCLSLPAILNRSGIRNVLRLDLSPEEQEKLQKSAAILKSTLRKLNL